MKMQSVSSSTIASVGYDEENKTLRIEFHSGRSYEYYKVPKFVYEGLLNADSVGTYFHRNIKDAYDFSEV